MMGDENGKFAALKSFKMCVRKNAFGYLNTYERLRTKQMVKSEKEQLWVLKIGFSNK
jgi:hypothetical protein